MIFKFSQPNIKTFHLRRMGFILMILFTSTFSTAQDPPELFQYNQSTQIAFYFIVIATINEVPLEIDQDWVGAFKNGICVGSRVYQGEYQTDVPAMGYEDDYFTWGYMENGDYPDFMIYDASEDEYYEAIAYPNHPWLSQEFFWIEILEGIGPDCYGTLGGDAFIDDCDNCVEGLTGMNENWAMDDCYVCYGNNSDMDCNGDCFGSAFYDSCNICSGGNSGHVPNSDLDCGLVCFGDHELDMSQDCCLDIEIDDCNVCYGQNQDMDCNGDCFGSADYDSCEICSGGNSGHVPDSDQDCASVCFGDHELDMSQDCCLDIEIDDCNVCYGENLDKDYCDVCFGSNDCPGNGDVIPSGSLDVLDAVRMISIIMEEIIPNEYELWAGDLIFDGTIDILDAVNLIYIIMSE